MKITVQSIEPNFTSLMNFGAAVNKKYNPQRLP